MNTPFGSQEHCMDKVIGSYTEQEINDQIATINSLTISDLHHPMDIVDTRPVTKSIRGIFPDNTAFTPQSTDSYLFSRQSCNPFMRQEDGHQLSRRESYPNLSTTYMANQHRGSVENYSDWHGYMQNTTMMEQSLHDDPSLFLMQPSEPSFRKYSMDAAPISLACKILDGKNRLTPSYSNPDLSSARRMGSLDGRLRHPAESSQRTCSLFGYNNTYPSFQSPLLVSHMKPPSSPTSRKNSMTNRRNNSIASTVSQQEQDRFATLRLEDVMDEIYPLCKDQYGCRFFQKKLEEQNSEQRDIIFNNVFPHFIELMTDPFGNYLCQKLMEYCTDSQRTQVVENVSKSMMFISLNMHGTRAVQKMIEFLSLPEQIEMAIQALSPNVVALIKDLNGNHVIQKCLHRLSSRDKQFIYDAVSEHCIEVATHRHGCCVLQRCIDFSAEIQKKQLVNEIIRHALTLVQDPFGNYVVQYVLDLGDAQFSDQLIRQFIGHVGALSVQKFSSNVMEKCIRVAEADTRRHLVEEMVNKTQLEKLLRDSYANYVVQTALDFAEPNQHGKLVECIRPLLPAIRNTPYGKRIQGKINREQKKHVYQSVHPLVSNDLSFTSFGFPPANFQSQ